MKLKEISRTATFAWGSSSDSLPLLATGTVSGALDETFSNVGQLEIWAPQLYGGAESDLELELGGEGQGGPRGSIQTNARFNRLAWSSPSSTSSRGVIASGMETGEISVWDAEKILSGSGAEASLLFKNDLHTGPVRGLDFNPIQKSLFASGAVNAELFIFDLTNPTKSHATGPRSTKLEEITSVQWNPIVPHILASSSSSGYTSVWDLRGKKEVISLAYGGGAATGMSSSTSGNVGGMGGMQVGGRRGMSDVCWQPDTSTRLITSSEDDTSPIIMVWDLRNSRAPEKILTGHEKGVLSVSWCKQDADMLLSCGKDNRTLCWNPQTCEIIGELPHSNNWSFQTAWCPTNPDLLATASFDGKIGIHTLQATSEPSEPAMGKASHEQSSVDDIFGGGSTSGSQVDSTTFPVMSLKQPPKWLKRPVAASFGFGGQLSTVSNLMGANGKNQSSVVHLRQISTEPEVADRAKKLKEVLGNKEDLAAFCEGMVKKDGAEETAVAGWKALHTLFTTNSRDELVGLLGFSKADVAAQVAEAIKNFKPTTDDGDDESVVPGTPKDASVTFLEPSPKEEVAAPEGAGSDVDGGASANSEFSGTGKAETETEMTEQSLFGGEDDLAIPGTPQADAAAGADFFSSMTTIRSALPNHVMVPHQGYQKDSSVAATIGSRASSVASETMKVNTFKIYPTDESEVDRLITRALVLGDFDSAVTLSLSVDRFADALILAVKGGPELLARTQKAYFERRTTALPFLRLFQSIVSNDLSDIVQNADLSEWQEIFVVLCTFAPSAEFNGLAEQLGQRLEFQYRTGHAETAKSDRQNALLCYLAAGRLEKVVNIWVDELREDEEAAVAAADVAARDVKGISKYTAHAIALQTFIEKVAVFKSATGYTDSDLAQPTSSHEAAQSGARTYRLSALYDRYYEYADLLATQGLTHLAVDYVKETPADYKGPKGTDMGLVSARERYMVGARASEATPTQNSFASTSKLPAVPPAVPSQQVPSAYGAYQAPPAPVPMAPAQTLRPPPAPASYASYAPPAPPAITDSSTNPYAPSAPYGSVQPQASSQQYGQYGNSGYGAAPAPAPAYKPSYGHAPASSISAFPPPPQARTPDQGPPIIPAAQRRDIPGWNDAPSMAAPGKRPPSATGNNGKPQPIMSPFPESQQQQMMAPPQSPMRSDSQPGYFAPPPRSQGPPNALPPPPRGAAPPRAASHAPPPPSGPPSGPPQGMQRAPSRGGPPPGVIAGPPPARAMSPLVPPQHRVLSPPMQTMPRPPSANPYMQQGSHQPPQQQQQQPVRPPSGQGPYGAPPPGQQRNGGPPPPSSRPSSAAAAPPKPLPAKPKYPAGDRSHIPQSSASIFHILDGELARVKQVAPPQQKRFVDDTERRLNILFDGLNCETISPEVVAQLSELVKAVAAHDAQAALGMHVDMLTRGPKSEDMTVWMTGIKQLIRLGM